jgi:hypothetical protein
MTPESIAAISVAAVNSVGLIVVAFIANRGRQHAKAAREEVQNDHSTNMRVEMDDRHLDNVVRLQTIEDWQTEHQRQVTTKLRRIGRLEVLMIPTFVAAVLGAFLHVKPRK